MTRRTRSTNSERPGLSTKPVAFAGGLLTLALAAGCGSSGSGTVAGGPPSSTPSASPSSTDFPGPSTSVTPSPSPTPTPTPSPSPTTTSLRVFNDPASGLTVTVPIGYVAAGSVAQAAERFPLVLGAGATTKITEAQTRLKSNTIMVAYHAPIGGLFDNIGIIKAAGEAPSDPTDIQSLTFRDQFRTSLTGAGAKSLVFTDTKVGGEPAENVSYSLASAGGTTFYGQQFYVPHSTDVFIATVTAGTAARAQAAANELVSTWTFS